MSKRLDEMESIIENHIMFSVTKDDYAYYSYGLHCYFLDEDVAFNIPTLEAAEQIAAIYQKAIIETSRQAREELKARNTKES
jgi:hypothetical protein